MTKTEKIVAVGAVAAVFLIWKRKAYARGVGSNPGESFDPNWGRVIRDGVRASTSKETIVFQWWFPEAYFGLGKWGTAVDLEKYGAHEPSIRAGHNVA